EFLHNGWVKPTVNQKFINHLEKHKIKYQIVGTTMIIFLCTTGIASANTGIDAGAERVYKKLLNVGKWVIIVKGAIDTIKAVADGDMLSARKNALGYGVTYMILHALPWG